MKTANEISYQTDVTVTVFVNEAADYILWIDAHDRLIASTDEGQTNDILTGDDKDRLLRLHGYIELVKGGRKNV